MLLAIAACGPTSRAPQHVEPVPHGDAGVAVVPAAPPTDAECRDLIAHVVALEVAHAGATLAAEAQATIGTSIEADFMAGCKKLTPRELQCGMAATTPAAFGACQPSASSSTSNSSVAPPGITPPAPRAP